LTGTHKSAPHCGGLLKPETVSGNSNHSGRLKFQMRLAWRQAQRDCCDVTGHFQRLDQKMRQINSAEASVPGALATVVARVIHVGSEERATVPMRACRQGGCCTNIPRPDGSIIGTVRVCRTMCPAKDKGVSCTKNSGIIYCTGGVNEPLESPITVVRWPANTRRSCP
jgi:hypothetical protein